MLFSFDAIESLPFFKKLPFSSKQKRILGIAVLLTTSIWLFVLTVFVLIRVAPTKSITAESEVSEDTTKAIFYEYDQLEIDALLLKIEHHIKDKQYFDAGELLQKLSYISEPSYKQLILTATLLIHQKRLNDAQKILLPLRKEYANDETVAKLYITTFSPEELAPPAWEQFVPEFTESPELLTAVAEIIQFPMPLEALPLLKKALKWDPNSVKTNFLLGSLLYRDLPIRDLTLSAKYLSKSVNHAPDSGHYHSAFALTLHALYEEKVKKDNTLYTASEKEYKEALNILPTNSSILYNLGELYSLKKENHINAENCFIQALSLHPTFWQASFKLGLLYLENEKYPSATDNFLQALEQSPNNIRILHQLAVSYEKSGNTESAQDTYNQILSINPKDDIALYKSQFNN